LCSDTGDDNDEDDDHNTGMFMSRHHTVTWSRIHQELLGAWPQKKRCAY